MNAVDSISRVNILGVGVHAINMQTAVDFLDDAATNGKKGYVTVTGVHGIVEAQDDHQFRDILNGSMLTTPDGMPTVWIGRRRGHKEMDRVYGPELMIEVCRRSVDRGHTHFVYGGQEGVAGQLVSAIEDQVPGVIFVGTHTPPFRPLNAEEESELREKLEDLQPDFFWVCLSTPKQEKFMAEYLEKLPATVMIGVGAACDILTGRVKDSPRWVKRSGLQWLHRLIQEPERLWKRYLINNPRFVRKLLRESWLQRFGGTPPVTESD
jgi:N-acetylglucosaminyldiphosphoundecaprenol N-acetyl-beta-D-mannosaminyltransferase